MEIGGMHTSGLSPPPMLHPCVAGGADATPGVDTRCRASARRQRAAQRSGAAVAARHDLRERQRLHDAGTGRRRERGAKSQGVVPRHAVCVAFRLLHRLVHNSRRVVLNRFARVLVRFSGIG